MNRLEELTLKLLDHDLSGEEVDELLELAKDDAARGVFLQLMDLESQLQSSVRESSAERVLQQIERDRCERVEEQVMRVVAQSSPFDVVQSKVPGRKVSRLASIAIGVAALAACLGWVLLVVSPWDGGSDATFGTLNPHGSLVRLIDADGRSSAIRSTDELLKLRPNQTIETLNAIDTAEIIYPDGTKIELLGETKVRLIEATDGSKRIDVLSGLINADVEPQPSGLPLRIVTQTATLEVLGTTLGVEVRDATTQLGVATGRVAMTRMSDGQRVEVGAGQFAMATESANEPFESHPFPELPTDWSEDFHAGLPTGWRSGELVTFQSEASVQAVMSGRKDDARFVITSHNAWQEGQHALFEINSNSVLHLRIRQRGFARITVMIGTRSYPPAPDRIGGNLFYTKKAWNEELPRDTWKTISIPLKDTAWQMKGGKRVTGPADLRGLATYLIHVSTMDRDAGLAIDRMWITNAARESQF